MSLSTGQKTGIWAAGLTVLTGATAYLIYQYSLLTDFCFQLTNFRVNNIDHGNISTSSILEIKNQSKLSVIIKGYFVDVYLDKFKISNIAYNNPITYAANSVSDIPLNINVQVLNSGIKAEEIAQLVVFYLTAKDKMMFTYKGYAIVELKAFGFIPIPIKIPFNISSSLQDLLKQSPTTCKME